MSVSIQHELMCAVIEAEREEEECKVHKMQGKRWKESRKAEAAPGIESAFYHILLGDHTCAVISL